MKNRQPDPTATKPISAPTAAGKPDPDPDERYRLVMDAVAEGIYEWSTETNHLELSTRLTEMFGFEKGELTSASWVEHVHPDDRVRYRDATDSDFTRHVYATVSRFIPTSIPRFV